MSFEIETNKPGSPQMEEICFDYSSNSSYTPFPPFSLEVGHGKINIVYQSMVWWVLLLGGYFLIFLSIVLFLVLVTSGRTWTAFMLNVPVFTVSVILFQVRYRIRTFYQFNQEKHQVDFVIRCDGRGEWCRHRLRNTAVSAVTVSSRVQKYRGHLIWTYHAVLITETGKIIRISHDIANFETVLYAAGVIADKLGIRLLEPVKGSGLSVVRTGARVKTDFIDALEQCRRWEKFKNILIFVLIALFIVLGKILK